jgi:hypothetical protein
MPKTENHTPEDTVPVEDMDQFVKLLSNWHTSKVGMLKHMYDIPEGTEAELNGGDKVIMAGDILKGFRMGITMALAELGSLPFVAELEDQEKAALH